jgi:hypothetical protein
MENARFRVTIGSRKPRDVRAKSGFTIGRAKKADLVLDDPTLDDIHAEIVGSEARGFRLQVMGISPLRVNRLPVRESKMLAVNDRIDFRGASLQLVADQPESGTRSAVDLAVDNSAVGRLKQLASPMGAAIIGAWVIIVGVVLLATGGVKLERYAADVDDYKKFVVEKLDSAECEPSWAVQPGSKERFRALVRNGVLAEWRGAMSTALTNYTEALSIAGDFRCVPVRFTRARRDAVKTVLPKQSQRL